MRRTVEPDSFVINPVRLWNEWLLLTGGDYSRGSFNTMTVAWGSLGVMWGRPFAQVVVRPTRYTFGFMERFETFTLSRFPSSCKEALSLLGRVSGRDGDKISQAGLHPTASLCVAAPSFKEAELVIECRAIYRDELRPEGFRNPDIASNYDGDYHRVYFGEIIAVSAADTVATDG